MKAKVYLETLGCQMNVADSERAATRLHESGYEVTTAIEQADAVIFNTCSVRAKAEQKVFNRIGEVRKQRVGRSEPVFGLMGCVAQLEGAEIFKQSPAVNLIVGTRATDRLPAMLDQALTKPKARLIDLGERDADDDWEGNSTARHSPYVAFVPIIEGCNKFCSYCIVPYSRGREKSRPAADIIREIGRLRAQGFHEVHLIGQNVNSYRPNNDLLLETVKGATPFSRLLRAVASTGFRRVKFTTSFPRDFHPDIVDAMDEYHNLCNWVHLPVQSGSDRILKAMRRGYTVSDYLTRVETIKKSPRQLALSTDIIVGYPGENDEDFAATKRLVELCRFDSLYLFKYSERKGTPAAQLTDSVSEAIKTERFQELDSLQRNIQQEIQASYIGRTVEVLAERLSTKSDDELAGHSTCHKVVNFPGSGSLIGHVQKVRITESKVNSLRGQTVSNELAS